MYYLISSTNIHHNEVPDDSRSRPDRTLFVCGGGIQRRRC
jgi:hypothetical protein